MAWIAYNGAGREFLITDPERVINTNAPEYDDSDISSLKRVVQEIFEFHQSTAKGGYEYQSMFSSKPGAPITKGRKGALAEKQKSQNRMEKFVCKEHRRARTKVSYLSILHTYQ
jgi:hypothetical protein